MTLAQDVDVLVRGLKTLVQELSVQFVKKVIACTVSKVSEEPRHEFG